MTPVDDATRAELMAFEESNVRYFEAWHNGQTDDADYFRSRCVDGSVLVAGKRQGS